MHTYLFYKCGKCGLVHYTGISSYHNLSNLIQYNHLVVYPNRTCGSIVIKRQNVALVELPFIGYYGIPRRQLILDYVTEPELAHSVHEVYPELFLIQNHNKGISWDTTLQYT